mgnify:CR=1 FL=1
MFQLFRKRKDEFVSGLRTYDFYKETDVTQFNGIPVFQNIGPKKDRWYIDLPEWPGAKANLELVAGADDLFEVLAQGKSRISVSFSDKLDHMIEKVGSRSAQIVLHHKGFGNYDVQVTAPAFFNQSDFPEKVWLCSVTEFIFGAYPDLLFIRTNEHIEPLK